MSLELAAVQKIQERLEEMNQRSKDTLIGPPALPWEDYQRGLGYRECLRQIREVMIPEILDELQKG